jgi:tyrosinase
MSKRKDAGKLSTAEQDAFKQAVLDSINDNNKYGAMVDIHADMSHRMHTMPAIGQIGTWRFLSWHRAYLMHLEGLLQSKNPSVTIPYWNWVTGGVPVWLASFKPTVNGVVNNRNNLTSPISDQARINALMAMDDYLTFSYQLELDPHNQGHVKLGMPMKRVPVAPCDPIFWMHHAQVDKVWAEWQVKFPGKGPLLTGTDLEMDPWTGKDGLGGKTDTVRTMESISKLGYSYV